MLRIKLSNFKNYSGRFHHVHFEGTGMKLYLIGGGARGWLLSVVKGDGAPSSEPNDFDWAVVGRGDYSAIRWDCHPKKKNRIEIESGSPHPDLESYFKSRDFAINQVAIDSKGNLFATKKALDSFRKGVLYLAEGRKEALTPREAVRACRFSMEYSLKMPASLRAQVLNLREEMVEEPVFRRYTLAGWDLEGFLRTL
jgi:hypothetical protein